MTAPEKPVRRPDHFEGERKAAHLKHECIGVDAGEVEKLSLICSKYLSCDGFCGACKDEAGKLETKKPIEKPVNISVDIQIQTGSLEQFLKETKELCEKFAVKDDGKPDYVYHWETI